MNDQQWGEILGENVITALEYPDFNDDGSITWPIDCPTNVRRVLLSEGGVDNLGGIRFNGCLLLLTAEGNGTRVSVEEMNVIDHRPWSKNQAIAEVVRLGYRIHYNTGESGDHGYGSRLYYKRADAPLNDYGYPLKGHATVSKVGRKWFISEFK